MTSILFNAGGFLEVSIKANSFYVFQLAAGFLERGILKLFSAEKAESNEGVWSNSSSLSGPVSGSCYHC